MTGVRRAGLLFLVVLLLVGAVLKFASGPYVWIHMASAGLEVALGLAILAPGRPRRVALTGTTLLFLAFSAYHGMHVLAGRAASSCACLGPIVDTSHAWALILCGVALGLAVSLREPTLPPTKTAGVLQASAAVGSLVAGIALALVDAPPTEQAPTPVAWSRLIPVKPAEDESAPRLVGVVPKGPEPRAGQPEAQPAGLNVRAVLQSTQASVEGVRVWWDQDGTSSSEPVAGSAWLPTGVGQIALPAAGGLLIGRAADGAWASRDVAAGQAEVTLEFSDAVVLSGTVRKLDGSPFPNVALLMIGRGGESPTRVSASTPRFAARAERLRVVTDVHGAFALRGLTSKSIEILTEDAGMEMVRASPMSRRRGVAVALPATDVSITVFTGSRRKMLFQDVATGLPVPPPIRARLEPLPAGLTPSCLIIDGTSASAELIWPGSDHAPESVGLVCDAPGYESTSVLLDATALSQREPILVRLARTPVARGSLRVHVPPPWSDAPNVLRVALQPRGAEGAVSCKVVRAEGQWIVPDVAPGRYDLAFAGVRLLNDFEVRADEVRALEVPSVPDLVAVGVRPTFFGEQAVGTFGFQIATARVGVWGGTGQVSDRGEINLGLYPVGDKLIVDLAREGEVSAPTVIQVEASDSGAMVVEVPLLEKLTLADVPPELR